MSGKKKKLTKILRFYHREAVTNHDNPVPKFGTIKSGITRDFHKKSTDTLSGGTLEPVKVQARFAVPSKYNDSDRLSKFGYNVGGFTDNNFKIGEDGHFDVNTTRIITKIKIECISNVNSEINYPKLHLNESTTNPATQKGYETRNEAYRLNLGGFAGFNLVLFENSLYNDKYPKYGSTDKQRTFLQTRNILSF